MKVTILTTENEKAGETELADEIFGQKVNEPLLYEAVKMQLANRRQGDASTLTRGQVSGTTAKIYRQKGTGRARHGDARANIFVGGGNVFGPMPRDWSYRLPAKARKGAVRAALSLKQKEGKLLIVDNFTLRAIKTKDALAKLSKLGVKSGCIVVDGENEILSRSVRNIPRIKLLRYEGLNAYDLLRYEHAVVTVAALGKVQEVFRP